MAASDPNLIVGALEALQMMECPVCMEVIHPPVFQCHNGHLICSSCLDQVSLCPTCRSQMPSPRIRNLLAENFVCEKCPNEEFGCQVRLTPNDRDQHVLNCEFRSFDFCRRIGLENAGIKCNKMVKKCDVSSHMKNEHNLTVFESGEAVISQEIDSGMENAARKWLPITFSAFNNHFFLNTELIVHENGSGATISWKCISSGSVEFANEFSVELTLFNSLFNTRWLKWEGSVASVEKINENSSLDVLLVPVPMLHQFNQSVGKLEWKTKIDIKKIPSDPFNQLTPCAVDTNPSAAENKLAYKLIPGKYKLKRSKKNDRSHWDEIIYSVNGTSWTKKLLRFHDSKTVEQTFNLGEEYQFVYNNQKRQATVDIVANMLIRKEKISAMDGTLIGEGIHIQEFKENEMVCTWMYQGMTTVKKYMKVSG